MKSIRIFQAGLFETGNSYTLEKSPSNHLIKVLRLKSNDRFTLFNGDGYEYPSTLEVSGKLAIVHINEKVISNNESSLNIHLLQGISKGERMDFAIQKSIELGVAKISPVITERTVVNLKGDRGAKKLDHWKKISISACEQSGRNTLPEIDSIQTLPQMINNKADDLKILLDPTASHTIQSLHESHPGTTHIQLLIGPEGGLSEKEISLAQNMGYKTIRFGPRILRTETAALAAITASQLLWGDL